jgi:demethylmenaquinone methyltransferase/2-methoxy-6-polyprenyl-1,4-benzoquinol methylase
MSGGIHRLWKSTMIDWLRPRAGQHFIDVAGGTGDIAFRILERLGAGGSAAASRVVVCDLTPAMLAVGRDRAIDRGILSGIEWVNGDTGNLPFADRSFDAHRRLRLSNLTHLDQALTEARRVLRPGTPALSRIHPVSVPMLDSSTISSSRCCRCWARSWRAIVAYQYLVEHGRFRGRRNSRGGSRQPASSE